MDSLHDNGLDPGDDERYGDESEEDQPQLGDQPNNRLPNLQRTRYFKTKLSKLSPAEISSRCRQAIEYMAETLDLDITLLLYYISWNLPDAVEDPVIRYARTGLMWSEELPSIIQNWHNPPRRHNTGVRTVAARASLQSWAIETVNRTINAEMRELSPIMSAPQSEFSEATVLSVKMDDIIPKARAAAPTFWSICRSASYTPRQEQRNTMKNPDVSVLLMLSMASYNRSHHRCKIQKMNAAYLRSAGSAAKVYDTFHSYGLSMSHSWVYNGVDRLAEAARASMLVDIEQYPWGGSHDNINIRFQKYEQRLENQTHFDSGTAATIFVIKDPAVVPPNNRALHAQMDIGAKTPITFKDILMLEKAASPRIRAQAVHRILRILLESEPFALSTYAHKDSAVFKPPPAVRQLPTGPQHATCQYVLDTVHIEEASYTGNESCLQEWLRQLKLDSPEEQRRLGTERTIVWVGDQLTVSRIRGIKVFRCFDLNAFQRYEFLQQLFGWLHAQITEVHSFHKQYLGISGADMGLRHDLDLLKRKGLLSTAVQGPFHQGMREALVHIAEAHFRDAWCVAGNVNSLEELRSKSPEQLLALANKILDEYASTGAVHKERSRDRTKQDDILIRTIQFNRDILDFLDLDEAMRVGDVGRMRDLLPRLLFRFVGGGHGNYVVETLEVIQGLECEWTEEYITYVAHYFWLVNITGRDDHFEPLDRLMERNIRDMKYTFAVQGPYTSWENIKRISAAIPALRRIKDHVEAEVNHYLRGKSHTSPEKEADIARLQASYAASKIHVYHRRRQLSKEHQVVDVIEKGSNPVTLKKVIGTWLENRVSEHSTREDWPTPSSSASETITQV